MEPGPDPPSLEIHVHLPPAPARRPRSLPPTILLWWPLALIALAVCVVVWVSLAVIGFVLEGAGRLLVTLGWVEGDRGRNNVSKATEGPSEVKSDSQGIRGRIQPPRIKEEPRAPLT